MTQIQNTDTFDTSCLLRFLICQVIAPSNSTPTTSCRELLHQSKCIEYYNNPREGGGGHQTGEETAIGKWGQDLTLPPG